PAIARVNRLFEGETLDSWLVRAAGLVEDQDVIEAYELASTANLFVLDVLNRSGKLSHSDVRAVFEAEALVSEGILYRGFAAVALRLACRSYIDLNEALSILDIHPNKPFSRAWLSNLVTKIELVDEEHLMLARLEALAKGITLGWSLIKNECVDEQMLKVLIEASFLSEKAARPSPKCSPPPLSLSRLPKAPIQKRGWCRNWTLLPSIVLSEIYFLLLPLSELKNSSSVPRWLLKKESLWRVWWAASKL
ncbi:MAG TPA: hypothetical protein PKC98_08875, partial [Candidatus Melainabacteria bacterium]|nr:hypothetical protein [Candidatus Melainabacteria bacterium]